MGTNKMETITKRIEGVTSITVARRSYEEILEACTYLVECGYILEDSPKHLGRAYVAKFIKLNKGN